MAIVANQTDLNSDVRNAAIRVELDFQKLIQNSSAQSAAHLAECQASVDALQAALTAAGAITA